MRMGRQTYAWKPIQDLEPLMVGVDEKQRGGKESHGEDKRTEKEIGTKRTGRFDRSGIVKLRTLRESYHAHQLAGRETKALKCLEEACILKRDLLGPTSKWTKETEKDFVKCSNVVASKLLRQGKLESSSKILVKAHELTGKDARASIATLNNIGMCLYNQELVEDGMKYILQANEIIEQRQGKGRKSKRRSKSSLFGAETNLNLSCCYFRLQKFEKSVYHAQLSVSIAQEQIESAAKTGECKSLFRESLIILLLCYHALGTCLRELGLSTIQVDQNRDQLLGLRALVNGVRVQLNAFEEACLFDDHLVQTALKDSLWDGFLKGCQEAAPEVISALMNGVFRGEEDNLLLCQLIIQQRSSLRIQRMARQRQLKKHTRAAMCIQREYRTRVYSRKVVAVQNLQIIFRQWLRRKKSIEVSNKSYPKLVMISSPVERERRRKREKKRRNELVEAKRQREIKKALERKENTKNEKVKAKSLLDEGKIAQRDVLAEKSRLRKLEQETRDLIALRRANQLSPHGQEVLNGAIRRWTEVQQLRRRRAFQAFLLTRKSTFGSLDSVLKSTAEEAPNFAAELIQARWRGQHDRNNYLHAKENVKRIQKFYRSCAKQRNDKLGIVGDRLRLSIRVVPLQKALRMTMDKNRVQAATKLQRRVRQYQVSQIDRRKDWSAIRIQKNFRGHMLRSALRKSEEDFDDRITRLQAWVRGNHARKCVTTMKDELERERRAIRMHLHVGIENGRKGRSKKSK